MRLPIHRNSKPKRRGWTLWQVLPRALPYLKPYWKMGAVSLMVMMVASLATLAQPWPLAVMLDVVEGKGLTS